MHDLVIEGATVVDGTGAPARAADVAVRDGLIVEVHGDGFLRHMVRTMVGTLVDVGAGRRDPAAIPRLLRSGDRQQAGDTAPAAGLTLVSVDYPAGVDLPHGTR